jgi:hypothetical protein
MQIADIANRNANVSHWAWGVVMATHHQFCEGHIVCPNCGDHCAKVVVWDQDDVPVTVLCGGCYETFNVREGEDTEPAAVEPISPSGDAIVLEPTATAEAPSAVSGRVEDRPGSAASPPSA